MTLLALSAALSLPISRLPDYLGDVAPHVIFRGPLMSFHHALDAAGIVNAVTIDPISGMAVSVAGLVVERGEMGGVIVREDAGDYFPDSSGMPTSDTR